MKIVAAMDSLKGSMTSFEAGEAVKSGILCAMPDAEVVVKPVADGGEGTTDALIDGLHGERVSLTVTGPLGEPVTAQYGILEDRVTAVMEMAQAAGLDKVPEGCRNPLKATTYGVGEMIRDAISKGCRKFLIGIGGSATNDGGVGMLKALGFSFLDGDGKEVGEGAENLKKIHEIKADGVWKELSNCSFRIACDVVNPLLGRQGSTYVYGPQKGIPREHLSEIDKGMESYAAVTENFFADSFRNIPGAGAAGGMGFAFLAYLKGELVSGVSMVLEAVGLEEELKTADIVITGEGRLDGQTVMGKTPVGVAKLAKKYGLPVLAFAGGIAEDANICNEAGIDAYFSIVPGVTSLTDAMQPETAKGNITRSVEQVFRLVRVLYKK